MEAIAVQKYIRMSPQKLRVVADMVRKTSPQKALEILPLVRKRAAVPLEKTIRAAMANAKQKGAKEEEMVFKEIQINEGRRFKWGQAVSRGEWHPIIKRYSHIRVVVETKPVEKIKEIKKEDPTTPKATRGKQK